mmetsp:Transcript_40591/g.71376  ORF Transcript_40591/g.71376 Transcript_40591/m.71376 type:complete len:118 (-) Transcript_40591:424-777(-)
MSHYHCCICVDAMIGRERCAIVSVKKMMCVREDLVLSGGNIVPSTSADIEVNHLVRRCAFWNGFVMGSSPHDTKKSIPQERRFLIIHSVCSAKCALRKETCSRGRPEARQYCGWTSE